MSDFRKLQSILNEYYGQYADFPSTKYRPNENGTDNGKNNTYRRPLPTTSPDKPSYAYSPMGTSPIDEEERVTGSISKEKLISMLDKEMEDAKHKEMDYCVFVLGKIREAVKRA